MPARGVSARPAPPAGPVSRDGRAVPAAGAVGTAGVTDPGDSEPVVPGSAGVDAAEGAVERKQPAATA